MAVSGVNHTKYLVIRYKTSTANNNPHSSLIFMSLLIFMSEIKILYLLIQLVNKLFSKHLVDIAGEIAQAAYQLLPF